MSTSTYHRYCLSLPWVVIHKCVGCSYWKLTPLDRFGDLLSVGLLALHSEHLWPGFDWYDTLFQSSELCDLWPVSAPPGYRVVGADVLCTVMFHLWLILGSSGCNAIPPNPLRSICNVKIGLHIFWGVATGTESRPAPHRRCQGVCTHDRNTPGSRHTPTATSTLTQTQWIPQPCPRSASTSQQQQASRVTSA